MASFIPRTQEIILRNIRHKLDTR